MFSFLNLLQVFLNKPINYPEIIQSWSRTVAERERQIASLNHAIAERDSQIDSLSQAYTDLDRQLKGIFNSISWRITKPIRCLRKIKGTIFWIIFSVIINFIKKPSLSPFKQFREYIFIRNNSLFDNNYYLKNNLDLANMALFLFGTILKMGQMKAVIQINFNTSFYLRSYADVATSKLTPLYHYIKYGEREGRFPSEEAFSIESKFKLLIVTLFRKSNSNSIMENWPKAFKNLMKVYSKDKQTLYKLCSDLSEIIYDSHRGAFVKRAFPDHTIDRRLNILYITGMFPSIEHGGGLRMFDILSSLTKRHNVDLYSPYIEALDSRSYELLKNRLCNLRLANNLIPDINDITKWLKDLRRDWKYYDIIQLEYPTTIYLVNHIRPFGKKIGYTFMESIPKSAAIDLRNKMLTSELGESLTNFLHCARLEKEISQKSDFLIAMSEDDASLIFDFLELPRISFQPVFQIMSFVSRTINSM